VGGRKDATDDDFFSILRDPAGVAITKVGEDLQDVLRPIQGDLSALVAEALALP
jgi:hypothetical protein